MRKFFCLFLQCVFAAALGQMTDPCVDTYDETLAIEYMGIKYHTCAQIAAPAPNSPHGICYDVANDLNKHFNQSENRFFRDICYRSCTGCVPFSSTPAHDYTRTTHAAIVATSTPSADCHSTRPADLCVNQQSDSCHTHKCSLPPDCQCQSWETKVNLTGTNHEMCYVCIDTQQPSKQRVDMHAILAALIGGVALLVLVVSAVWIREKKANAKRRRRQQAFEADGDDVPMLVPDVEAEADSLEEAMKLLPWLQDAEQKRASASRKASQSNGVGIVTMNPMSHTDYDNDQEREEVHESMTTANSVTVASPRPCTCVNPKGSKAKFCPTCGGVVN